MAYNKVKSSEEIAIMRTGGKILADIINSTSSLLKPGISTKELADLMQAEAKKAGASSALKGFMGYPENACISLNDEVVHGMPAKSRKLRAGDLVTLDFTLKYQGLIVDTAKTFYVGDENQAPEDIKRLLNGTREALTAGIKALRGPTKTGDVSSAIQTVLDRYNLGIVRDLVGHGVGHEVHEDPNIPNYGVKNTGQVLQPGMTLAIEPMATLGGWQVDIKSDGWTVVTRDGSLAAHFEHTVLITDGPAEILTA